MQLVGATRWFIQWALLLEGILEGAAAAAMATVVLAGLYALGAMRISSALPFLPLVSIAEALQTAATILFAAGVIVGPTGRVTSWGGSASPSTGRPPPAGRGWTKRPTPRPPGRGR